MKLSVSLPDEDVLFLDAYAAQVGLTSRSAVVQRAIDLLRSGGLGPAYEAAWREWDESGEAKMWETVAADGVRVDAAW